MKTLQDIARLIKDGLAKRIVVLAGAGISTPSGLPDFRTPKSGLYDQLDKYKLPYPMAVFDISYFVQNPVPFYQIAHKLYPGLYFPNEAHYFVRLLQNKRLLLRMYTQNIDGLETIARIDRKKLVEAHGSFATASCIVCGERYTAKDIEPDVVQQKVPRCKSCEGVIKPNIVFFGEQLPQRFLLHLVDMPITDLLIVMGTSLEVHPVADIVWHVRPTIPRLLINKTAVDSFSDKFHANDVVFQGDVIEGVNQLCCIIGWQDELKSLMDNRDSHDGRMDEKSSALLTETTDQWVFMADAHQPLIQLTTTVSSPANSEASPAR